VFENASFVDVLGFFKVATSVGTSPVVPYAPGRLGTTCVSFMNNALGTATSVTPTVLAYPMAWTPMLPLTLACWVWASAFTSTQVPLCFGNATTYGLEVQINTSGQVWVQAYINGTTYNAAAATGTVVPVQTWVHVVATLGPVGSGTGYTTLYLNGAQVAQSGNYTAGALTASQGASYPNTQLRLGNETSTNAYSFKGYLDDVRVYTRALSAAEVRTLYQAQTRAGGTGGLGLTMAAPTTLNGAVSASRLGPYFPFLSSPQDVTGTVAASLTGGLGYTPFRAGLGAAYFANEANVLASSTAAANYVNAPFAVGCNVPLTVACWAHFAKLPQAAGQTSTLVNVASPSADGFALVASYAGPTACAVQAFAATVGGTFASPLTVVPLNTWTHLTGVYVPGTSLGLYANGALVGSNVALTSNATALLSTVGVASVVSTLRLANAGVTGYVRPYAGYLADVRVYTRVLGSNEALALVQAPQTLAAPGSAAYSAGPLVALTLNGTLADAAGFTSPTVAGTGVGYAPALGSQALLLTSPMPAMPGLTTAVTYALPTTLGSASLSFWFAVPTLPLLATGAAPVNPPSNDTFTLLPNVSRTFVINSTPRASHIAMASVQDMYPSSYTSTPAGNDFTRNMASVHAFYLSSFPFRAHLNPLNFRPFTRANAPRRRHREPRRNVLSELGAAGAARDLPAATCPFGT